MTLEFVIIADAAPASGPIFVLKLAARCDMFIRSVFRALWRLLANATFSSAKAAVEQLYRPAHAARRSRGATPQKPAVRPDVQKSRGGILDI
jgi:hypothetical protein